MKGLWRSKYYGWIKDCKRKKQKKLQFLKDNYVHDRKMKRISISEKKECDLFKLKIKVSFSKKLFYINNYEETIANENITKTFESKILNLKGVFFNNDFYYISKRNRIGEKLDYIIRREFFYKDNFSCFDIKIEIIEKVLLEKKLFNLKNKVNDYYIEKEVFINNENHFIKYKNKKNYRNKYAKKRFNKFSRNEGKKISSNYEEDIKFKIPTNILSWLK